jgi:uncharacterized membrane protein HdeD (DUF308 family)
MQMSAHSSRGEIAALQPKWGWFLGLGVALLLLGGSALVAPLLTTLASVVFYGWLLFASGISEAIAAFSARPWSGVLLHLLGGILNIVVGVAVIGHPGAGAQGLTLLFASLFLVGGLFRAAAAVVMQFPSWGWAAAGGAVTALLGAMVWREWPSSSQWVIGTYVGVELVSRGWSLVMFALAARRLTSPG